MSNKLLLLLNGKRPLGAYFQSWSSAWSGVNDGSKLDLALIDKRINVVFLSFVNPNCKYIYGSNTFSGTGLDFSSDFNIVKNAISILKKRGCLVILSAGGATYSFANYNVNSLVSLANDLNVDGIDIDFESNTDDKAMMGKIINDIRKVYKSLLSIAAFSVGAYGEGIYSNSQPSSSYTGMCIPGLKTDGDKLDFINLMSYDASNAFDPIEAFKAYRSYFSGPILIGCETPPEAWGGHVLSIEEVKKYTKYTIEDNNKGNGVFVWSYQKPGTPSCIDIISCANNIYNNIVPSPVKPNVIVPPKPQPFPTPAKPNVIPIIPPFVPKPEANITLWVVGRKYNTGDKVLYKDGVYRCIQSHVAQIDWTPSIYTKALWCKL